MNGNAIGTKIFELLQVIPQTEAYRPQEYLVQNCQVQTPRLNELPTNPSRIWFGKILQAFSCEGERRKVNLPAQKTTLTKLVLLLLLSSIFFRTYLFHVIKTFSFSMSSAKPFSKGSAIIVILFLKI